MYRRSAVRKGNKETVKDYFNGEEEMLKTTLHHATLNDIASKSPSCSPFRAWRPPCPAACSQSAFSHGWPASFLVLYGIL